MSNGADIETQAAAWIARLDSIGSDTNADLAAWLAADPRHRAAYLRLAEAWRRTAPLERLRPIDGFPDPDLLAPQRRRPSVPSLRRDQPSQQTAAPPRRSRSLRERCTQGIRWPAVAALAAALAFGLWWLQALPRTQVYRTGAHGLSRVVLSDGSSVILNSSTVIRVRFTPGQRNVWLAQGEAHFLVAHDMDRPFEVHASHRIVLAVGTAFDVRLSGPRNFQVTVTEGRVALMASSDASPKLAAIPPPTLGAGEMALISAGQVMVSHITPQALSRQLAWEHREISFRGETLAEAVAEFNRYNPHSIAIDDPAIASLRVGGNFDALDTASFVAALQRTFGIGARTEGGTTHLIGPASP